MEGVGSSGATSGGMDPNDIFAELFGGGAGMRFDFSGTGGGMPGGYSRRTKGQDSVIPYEVTLEDLYNGKSVKMMMEKEIVCGTCKGSVNKLVFFHLARPRIRFCIADRAQKEAPNRKNVSNAKERDGLMSRRQ